MKFCVSQKKGELMKILIIHNRYQQSGGEQEVVNAQIQLLREKGHEISVFERDNSEIAHYTLIQKFLFFFETIFSLKTVININNLFRNNQPDIVHVHNVFPLISPSVYWAVHRHKVPIVQTIHNFRFLCPNGLFYTNGQICERCKMGNMLHALRWRCYRNSIILSALYAFAISLNRCFGTFNYISAFIVLNSFTANKLIESGITRNEKIRLIPNFLSGNLPENGPPKRFLEAIYLGRLSQEKGIHLLIEGIKRIPGLHLRILGVGPMEDELKQLADGAYGQIDFEGFVTGIEKNNILKNALMLVIPSVWYEQFPMTALEGMALGVPIIGPNLGGWSSIIEDGENGFLFEPENVDDLANKMKLLYDNPGLAYQMGLKGRQLVAERFSADNYYSEVLKIYQSLFKEKKYS